MATPQLEDGYTKIVNPILEQLAKINLSPYETRTIMCIFRKTYGYGKKWDYISLDQFSSFCGLDKRLISRTVKKLVERKLIIRRDDKDRAFYCFNKDFSQWISSSPEISHHLQRCEPSSPEIHTKETITKETLINNISCKMTLEDFEDFWQQYPRKINKKTARKKFLTIPRSNKQKILLALEDQKTSSQWQEERYIPHPTTWLNGERWEDEIKPEQNRIHSGIIQPLTKEAYEATLNTQNTTRPTQKV